MIKREVLSETSYVNGKCIPETARRVGVIERALADTGYKIALWSVMSPTKVLLEVRYKKAQYAVLVVDGETILGFFDIRKNVAPMTYYYEGDGVYFVRMTQKLSQEKFGLSEIY